MYYWVGYERISNEQDVSVFLLKMISGIFLVGE